MSATANHTSRFLCDHAGTALVEFAWALPFLLLALLGVYNISQAANAERQLSRLSDGIATQLVTNGVVGAASYPINYTDLHYANDSAMLEFPLVLSDSYAKNESWAADISISMAGISFSPTVAGCTSGCTYVAKVVWTGGNKARACGSAQVSATDSATPSPSTLPQDLFDPVPTPTTGVFAPPNFQIVVDVVYAWHPLLGNSFIPPISFKRSTYLTPRYVSQITYSQIAGDDGFGVPCP